MSKMGKFKDLFLKQVHDIIKMYQGFLLTEGRALNKRGKIQTSEIEVKLYQLNQKVLDFDTILEKEKKKKEKKEE